MLSLRGFPLCQTHTSEIESVEAGLAQCLNQSHVDSCRTVITNKCEIITEENSREEECHVPHGRVSLILRSFVYVHTGINIDSEFDCTLLVDCCCIQLILSTCTATGNC